MSGILVFSKNANVICALLLGISKCREIRIFWRNFFYPQIAHLSLPRSIGWVALSLFVCQKIFWQSILFQKWSEMARKLVKSLFSRIKAQSRRPFWDNSFLFFLLFNLRWAQLYVSLVFSHIQTFQTSLQTT